VRADSAAEKYRVNLDMIKSAPTVAAHNKAMRSMQLEQDQMAAIDMIVDAEKYKEMNKAKREKSNAVINIYPGISDPEVLFKDFEATGTKWLNAFNKEPYWDETTKILDSLIGGANKVIANNNADTNPAKRLDVNQIETIKQERDIANVAMVLLRRKSAVEDTSIGTDIMMGIPNLFRQRITKDVPGYNKPYGNTGMTVGEAGEEFAGILQGAFIAGADQNDTTKAMRMVSDAFSRFSNESRKEIALVKDLQMKQIEASYNLPLSANLGLINPQDVVTLDGSTIKRKAKIVSNKE
jgi:hypothetical protein